MVQGALTYFRNGPLATTV